MMESMSESYLKNCPSPLGPKYPQAEAESLTSDPSSIINCESSQPAAAIGNSGNPLGKSFSFSPADFPPLNPECPAALPKDEHVSDPAPANQWAKPPVIAPRPTPKFLLKFSQPVIRDSRKIGVCSAEVVRGEIPALDNTLIGFFLGKRPSFTYVKSALLKQWRVAGTVDMFMLLHGGFVFRFSHANDRDEVLETGIFHVGGQPIFLRQWDRSIHTGLLGLKHIPLWVSLPGLPLHLWSEEALSVICSTLGRPLYCDKHTAMKTRLSFARVCIEFSANEPLEKVIEIEDDEGNIFMQPVSYDWRPPHCLSCGVFGHDLNVCRMGPATAMETENLSGKKAPGIQLLQPHDVNKLKEADIPSDQPKPVTVHGKLARPDDVSTVAMKRNSGRMHWGDVRVKKMNVNPTIVPDPNCNSNQYIPPFSIGSQTDPPAPAIPEIASDQDSIPHTETESAPAVTAPHMQPPTHLKQLVSKNPTPCANNSDFNRFEILNLSDPAEIFENPSFTNVPAVDLLTNQSPKSCVSSAPAVTAPHMPPPTHLKQLVSKNPTPCANNSDFNSFEVLTLSDPAEIFENPSFTNVPAVDLLTNQSPKSCVSSAGHTPYPKNQVPKSRTKFGKKPSDLSVPTFQTLSNLAKRPLVHSLNRRVASRVPYCVADSGSTNLDPWIDSSNLEKFPPPLAVKLPAGTFGGGAPMKDAISDPIDGSTNQFNNGDKGRYEESAALDGCKSDSLLDDEPIQECASKKRDTKNSV